MSDIDLQLAVRAVLPAVRAASDDCLVLADGFSCRTQLEQLADRPGIHLAELLARHLSRPR